MSIITVGPELSSTRCWGETFSGVLTSDFYAAYNDTPGGKHQRCWAHLLRDLHALKEAPASSLEAVVWAKAVKDAYLLAKGWLAQGRAPEHAYRELVLLIRVLGEQFAEIKGHPCQALAKRLLRHQDELFVFVRQPGVPADNNLAERSLRPLVIARKISGGTRSAQGSQTCMTLTSLFQTWQARGLNPLLECRRLLQSPFPNSEQLPYFGYLTSDPVLSPIPRVHHCLAPVLGDGRVDSAWTLFLTRVYWADLFVGERSIPHQEKMRVHVLPYRRV